MAAERHPESVISFIKKKFSESATGKQPILKRVSARGGLFAGLVALFLFFSARPAQAFVLNWIAFGISWLISMLASIAIALEAWILGFVLQISTNIVNSPVVAVGFPVSLSIANLFFVLAIIIIAIATILRFQTYGIKQALWRLVVMAIAVNFGLIIAGGILGFSDSLSGYFLSAVDPTAGQSSLPGGVAGVANTSKFASAIAGAFQPQQVALLDASKAQGEGAGGWLSSLKNAWSFVTGDVSSFIGAEFLQPIAMLVFTIFFLLFMVIVLGVLIAMLIIRYVYLGYLLILLPLAWAAWIFPSTRGQWNKWWTTFIKQTFFAPIVLFFMWVAIQVSYQMSNLKAYNIAQYQSPSNAVWGGLAQFFTNLFSGTFQQFLQLTVLLGVMLGGIFAAQSMSIKFADAGVKAAMGSAKGFGGWAARKGKQIGTAPLRGQRGQKLAASLQQTQRAVPLLGRIPGVNRLATMGASYAGGALQQIGTAGAEKSIEAVTEGLKGKTSAQMADMMTRADAPTRMAILKKLYDSNELHLIKNLDRYLGANQAELFNRYNLGESYKKWRGESGVEFKELVMKAARTRAETPGDATAITAAETAVMNHLSKAKNTASLTKMLIQDSDKLETLRAKGDLPLGYGGDIAGLQEMQKYFVRGALTSFSGNALSKMVSEIQSADQERIVNEISQAAGLQGIEPSEAFKKYERSSPARTAGFSRTWFNLPEQQENENGGPRIITPPGAGEPRNPPRYTARYDVNNRPVNET